MLFMKKMLKKRILGGFFLGEYTFLKSHWIIIKCWDIAPAWILSASGQRRLYLAPGMPRKGGGHDPIEAVMKQLEWFLGLMNSHRPFCWHLAPPHSCPRPEGQAEVARHLSYHGCRL